MDDASQQPCRVVVTRAMRQAAHLIQLCRAADIEPFLSPMITIEPLAISYDKAAILQRVSDADWVIFTSANAITYAFPYAHPLNVKVACIGKKTAALLTQFGVKDIFLPDSHYTSEGLLELDCMQHVKGQKIVIITGESGRSVLADTLKWRGANVVKLDVYRRRPVTTLDEELLLLLNQQKINAVFASSGQILKNFMSLYAEHVTIDPLMFIVAGSRVSKLGTELGIDEKFLITAVSAHDEDMLAALISWQRRGM